MNNSKGQLLIEGAAVFSLFCLLLFGFFWGFRWAEKPKFEGLVNQVTKTEKSCSEFFSARQHFISASQGSLGSQCLYQVD